MCDVLLRLLLEESAGTADDAQPRCHETPASRKASAGLDIDEIFLLKREWVYNTVSFSGPQANVNPLLIADVLA